MKKIMLTLLAAGGMLMTSANAQTQKEMTDSAGKSLTRKDKVMRLVLKRIFAAYKDDKAFLEKLKLSQKAWEKFRDAHLEAMFPAKDKFSAYGSFFPVAYDAEKEALTDARIKQLKRWLNGVPEGVVGGGSIKFKKHLPRYRNRKTK